MGQDSQKVFHPTNSNIYKLPLRIKDFRFMVLSVYIITFDSFSISAPKLPYITYIL